MINKRELSFLEKNGWIEAYIRCFAEKFPRVKRIIKRYLENNNKKNNLETSEKIDVINWGDYQKIFNDKVNQEDIILIHSSMDGLKKIGVSAEQCMIFLRSLISKKNCTIVMACFPITNLKPPSKKSRPYDPKKTLCWTGLLSNAFISESDCIRSRFPFNSLAAIGPKAEEMMSNDLAARQVYDCNSAWRYCYEHHSKIFFMGVKASRANTMAIHMIPDMMGDNWPIFGWYEEKEYKIKIDGDIINVPVSVQKDFWYKYVMEEGTSGKLKQKDLLVEYDIGGCNLGFIQDSKRMVDFLITESEHNRLVYLIPPKYYK